MSKTEDAKTLSEDVEKGEELAAADSEQTAALGYCLLYAQRHLLDGRRNLRQVVEELEALISAQGLAALCASRSSVAFLARPRRQEIFACLNRYRELNL